MSANPSDLINGSTSVEYIANVATNDYVSAFATVFAALSGYIYAQKTGKGQVIDELVATLQKLMK